MTRSMFRSLNELKSNIVVVDKLLETTLIANYSKSTHRIKHAHAHAKHVFTISIINNSPCSLPVHQLHV